MRNTYTHRLAEEAKSALGKDYIRNYCAEVLAWAKLALALDVPRVPRSPTSPMSSLRRLNIVHPHVHVAQQVPAMQLPWGAVARDAPLGPATIFVYRTGRLLAFNKLLLAEVFASIESSVVAAPSRLAKARNAASRAFMRTSIAAEAAAALGRVPPGRWTPQTDVLCGYNLPTVGRIAVDGFSAPGVTAYGFFTRAAGKQSAMAPAVVVAQTFLDAIQSGSLDRWTGMAPAAGRLGAQAPVAPSLQAPLADSGSPIPMPTRVEARPDPGVDDDLRDVFESLRAVED